MLIIAAVNYWLDWSWPLYLGQFCSVVLFINSAVSERSRQVSVSAVGNDLVFRNDAKNYQVTIPKQDIEAIRLRRYPLFKALIIDIKGNQRLTLNNAFVPADFPV
ncbi:hypothetical protein [Pseudomonas anguilliseptica]|uniref:hypothetical protein n=1 Tax=Pseudomonas anguilliseptica TaxID=53406 RepID=UPI003735C962